MMKANHERPRRRGMKPTGSAGVPPACTPVACCSVSPRWGTRAPCRRKRQGMGRSRVLAPLPSEPGGGDGPSCARTCAGGTPALPGGPSSHHSCCLRGHAPSCRAKVLPVGSSESETALFQARHTFANRGRNGVSFPVIYQPGRDRISFDGGPPVRRRPGRMGQHEH